VPITWLEYAASENPSQRWKVVSFDTASRAGEPFEAVIRQRNYLPNPVTRFCTSELKIRTMHKWLRANWAATGLGRRQHGVGSDDRHPGR
jgi:3'-phosphoadenosine 5'-phosphosulfate sulfotransferase (PAPS reductase)/FAD synthetase